jgi:hypothetical protein
MALHHCAGPLPHGIAAPRQFPMTMTQPGRTTLGRRGSTRAFQGATDLAPRTAPITVNLASLCLNLYVHEDLIEPQADAPIQVGVLF